MLFLPFLKLLANGNEFVTTIYMKKLLLFISFPMIYYMVHSDERFKSFMYTIKNTFWCIQKNLLNRREYEKKDQHDKVVCLQQLSIDISFAQFQ